jgi:cell division protein FtsI/penicillin-binding protein 2
LIVVLLLAAGAVLWRLWHLQVVQHDIWAEQARLAMRSGQVEPYNRGAIRDRSGQPLVRDVGAYRLELNYREFRRGHPLGLVAHARSVLEERPVTLEEAAETLYDAAALLTRLSPGEIYAYGRGAPLQQPGIQVPGTDQPYRDERPSRAADLAYYVKALFDLSRSERGRLIKLERSPRERRSYLELVAEMRALEPADLLAERAAAWQEAGQALADLANRLPWRAGELDQQRAPLDHLIGQLEAWRASLEDAAAARLFADVLGFEAGRMDPGLLLETHDLAFLRREMGWDQPRLIVWAYQTRSAFLRSWRDGFALERLLAELRLSAEPDADRVLSQLASLYADSAAFDAALNGEPIPWRNLQLPAVFPVLPTAYALSGEVAAAPAPLEVFDPLWRQEHANSAGFERLVQLIEPGAAAALSERCAKELEGDWKKKYRSSLAEVWRRDQSRGATEARERVRSLAIALLDSFEVTFQARLREYVAQLLLADPDQDGLLSVAEDRLDRLSERAKSLLKDYGSRPAVLHQEPSDEVVFLLSRFGQRFPGIEVKSYRERERLGENKADQGLLARGAAGRTGPKPQSSVTAAAKGGVAANGGANGRSVGNSASKPAVPLLAELLGSVSALDAEAMQRQRQRKSELDGLKAKVLRSSEEEQRLRSLMQELLLADETRGVSGLEAYLDRYLRGQNGYRERLGLEDVYGRGARSVALSEVVDGEDVWLTIDPALQRSTARLINRPDFPDYDPKADREWFEHPVGAIVLCTPEGRLLALASAPDLSALERVRFAEGQAALITERTLRKPTFQPLGSVFKPFVAVHALDRLDSSGFDPSFTHTCAVPPGFGWAEWGGVRCHVQYGHGTVDLLQALHVSCNCYFSRLGDDMGAGGIADVAAAFGFGQPTGVEALGPSGPGFEAVPRILEWNRTADLGRQIRRAANGLQVIEGTPAQLARALCGLATGRLPALQLIERVGEQFLEPPPPQQLPYGDFAFAFVREAMWGVANAREGSAYAELSAARIGLEVAVKTGSADLVARSAPGLQSPRRGKHTWLAGWAPAHEPRLIFAIFLHDTVATAGHSAAVLGRQLFELPEVRAYLESEGVTLSAPGGAPGPKASSSRPVEARFPNTGRRIR